jgi:superfamily II DNA or RNA helicase
LTGWRAPFIRSDQPLKWELVHNSASESYSLRLVNDHGVQPAEPFLTLPGQPALYVTEECIYQGPTPLREELARSVQSIPAPVLEQQKGVEFIDRLGVPLPSHLAGRTRKCPYKVRLECRLNSASGRDEALEIRVLASPEGHPQVEEFFSATGWQKTDKTGSPPKDEGIIYLFDRSAMNEFPSAFDLLNPKWDFFHNLWRLKISKTFPERFTGWLESLPARFELSLDSELQTLQSSPVSARINLNCEEAGIDWFDIRVVLDVSDTELTQEELNLLLSAQGRHVRLGNKGWRKLEFILSEEEDATLARLGLNASDFNAEPQRLHALQLADKSASRFLPEPQVEALQRRVDELKTRVSPPLPRVIQAELRPYQVEGFHFLAYLTENRFGGILADDMGLGKTVQTLTWLAWLREQTPGAASSLVVCPKSVADNWRAEAERFYPGLRVQIWGAGMAESELDPSRFDLLVINYVQLRVLQDALAPRSWQAVILDEGQYIKNPNSQTARSARALKADHRLVLSGTPIENRLLDLWSLMAFAMPGVLGNRNAFVRQFDRKGDPYGRLRLSARVRPFLLRRTKDQVAGDLPDRIEEDLYCELESEQMTLYRAELKRAQQMLLSVKTQKELDQQRFHFLTSLLRLRQICCHPGLVSETAANASSAKMETLLELLDPIMEEGHKVLVFSQFVTLLEILREAMAERGWTHFFLSGQTEDRGKLVRNFQEASGAAVFLISLKAGGFGLNLTSASYVVLFDPWWNPAVENQAIDRTHRIGQVNKVIAYRLLVKNTIEEKIRSLQKQKSALVKDILGEEGFARQLTVDDFKFLFSE